MQNRFKQLLDEKGLTATKFAAIIKVNASAMSHILNGRSKPGFDVLDKIALAFPDVNLNWLISGKGTPYNNTSNKLQQEKITAGPITTVINPVTIKPESVEPDEKKEVQNVPVVQEIEKDNNPQPAKKQIKRTIIFFDDGSFEAYEA